MLTVIEVRSQKVRSQNLPVLFVYEPRKKMEMEKSVKKKSGWRICGNRVLSREERNYPPFFLVKVSERITEKV